MILNVHAGHNPDGKPGCGAVGLLKESTENRVVKDKVINLLRARGHTVYDCTVDDGTSAKDVLKKIAAKCNKHKVDLDVSIHFNAGAKSKRDGKITGFEAYIFNSSSKAKPYAEKICKAAEKAGYTNRGVKTNKSLYFLSKTVSPAVLLECCFVDDPDDVALYNPTVIAEAIVSGITGMKVCALPYTVRTPENTDIYADGASGSDVRMVLKSTGVYTIVEEKDGFGKLKSGAGWLDLSKVART